MEYRTNKREQPEKKFRVGGISATVWNNNARGKDGEPTVYKTVTLDRAYKDSSGAWQSANSLRMNDVPKALMALDAAYRYLVNAPAETNAVMEAEDASASSGHASQRPEFARCQWDHAQMTLNPVAGG